MLTVRSIVMKQLTVIFASILTTLGLPPQDRILGGNLASPGQFPFIVALNNPYQFCDGSIINKNWVLTAAHCVDILFGEITVVAGTTINHSGGTTYNISKAISHEGYKNSLSGNDIGLIKIDGEFEYGEAVQPIELGEAEANATCVVAGWGATEDNYVPRNLSYVELTALSFDDCQSRVGESDEFYFGPEIVCAFGGEGRGVCYGDSGGPLTCDGKLVGVVSQTVAPCAEGYPDLYVRPLAYLDWINEKINEE